MSILFCTKVFSDLVDNGNNIFYSPVEFNAALGKAEKYFFHARPTQISGTTPTLQVSLETSNDGVNWNPRSTPISAVAISTTTPALFGSEAGTAQVGGCFARIGVKLGGGTPVAFVEVWVTGRTAV